MHKSWSIYYAQVMEYGHAFYRSAFVLLFIFLLSWAGIDNYKFDHTGYYQTGGIIGVQSLAVFSSTLNSCHCRCLALVRHFVSPREFHRLVHIRFLGRRLLYSVSYTHLTLPSKLEV